MLLSAQAIADYCQGTLIGHSNVPLRSVSIDSRQLGPDSLFVALPGERVDGHDFLVQAHANGAKAVLVTRAMDALPCVQILVADTQRALGLLAKGWRSELPGTRLALTGSNGKTTVKNLTESILSRVAPCIATAGNFNNEIGLPLSILRAEPQHAYLVLELGAGAPGDIAYLADIAAPSIALVNNAGPAHLERLGNVAGVAQEKSAIYRALPADGVAVLPQDDAELACFERASAHCHQIRFGLSREADIRAESIELMDHVSEFQLVGPFGRALVRLPLLGKHNVRNALAAAAMSYAAGADLNTICAGLDYARAEHGRLNPVKQPSGWVLIDDSYNANPSSVMAAMDTLSQRSGKRIFVLGDMAELGPQAQALHEAVGRHAREVGLDLLITLGAQSALAAQASGIGRSFSELAPLLAALHAELTPTSTVLVKGSRSSRMERVVAGLTSIDSAQVRELASC